MKVKVAARSNKTLQKFEQLCALADELNIRIEFHGHRTTLTDYDSGKCYDVADIESSDDPLSELPASTEMKLILLDEDCDYA